MSLIEQLKSILPKGNKEDKINFIKERIFMEEMSERMNFELVNAWQTILTEVEAGD